jgi:UDP-N-acetylglucosamine 2-epimerase
MEAGNRCKDECLPEETNRRIVDVISDVNLCYSEFARKYLADTGLPKERTYMTGSPMAEVLRMNLEKIEASDVLERLGLEENKYILLSAHREENIDTEKNFTSLFTAINAWQKSTICRFCTPAIRGARRGWRQPALNWIHECEGQ